MAEQRLIDANALDTRERGNNSQRAMWWEIRKIINEAPTVDAKPVVHAHWISDGVWDICSNCHGQHVQPHIKGLPTHLYCPYCGATMDEEIE